MFDAQLCKPSLAALDWKEFDTVQPAGCLYHLLSSCSAMVHSGTPCAWTFRWDRRAFCAWCNVSATFPTGPVWADDNQHFHCMSCWNQYIGNDLDVTPRVSLAFSEADAWCAQHMDHIPTRTFRPVNYLPLRDSIEWAIESGMRGATKQAAQAAVQETVWWVVEVSLPASAAVGDISRARDHKGWRLFQPLCLSSPHAKWAQHRVPASGLENWASWSLWHLPVVQGHDAVCSAQHDSTNHHDGKLWAASASQLQKPYCAECWNMYFQRTAPDLVFRQSTHYFDGTGSRSECRDLRGC